MDHSGILQMERSHTLASVLCAATEDARYHRSRQIEAIFQKVDGGSVSSLRLQKSFESEFPSHSMSRMKTDGLLAPISLA
ncbi:hypothetical protein EGK_03155 [Macaca mulatta]|uniref:Uncharacterized protein n=1 Tax=Macaca mulatta TaxID=9544 RepID=G7N472_MACMU|nr:hypothetical protein EGK_03155 [Macaca mulatta]